MNPVFVFSHAGSDGEGRLGRPLAQLFLDLQEAVREQLARDTAIGVGFHDPELPWHPGVARATARCRVHVMVLSRAFVASVDCGRRLTLARLRESSGGGELVLPLRLDATPVEGTGGAPRVDGILRRVARRPEHPAYRELVAEVAGQVARIAGTRGAPALLPIPETLEGVASAFGAPSSPRPRRAAAVSPGLGQQVDRVPVSVMLGLGLLLGGAVGAAVWSTGGAVGTTVGLASTALLAGAALTGRPLPVEHSGFEAGVRRLLVGLGVLAGAGLVLGYVLLQEPIDAQSPERRTRQAMVEIDERVQSSLAQDGARLPSGRQDLPLLVGSDVRTTDGWGNELVFVVPGPDGLPYDIVSLGADGRQGGTGEAADIRYSDEPSFRERAGRAEPQQLNSRGPAQLEQAAE